MVFAPLANASPGILWETGSVTGHVDSISGAASGTFTFDAGDLDCEGVDYSSVASPGSPGTWSVTFALPGPSNTWQGSYQASSADGSLTFGSTDGTYLRGFTSLALEGPITFSTTGSVPPLPAALTSPFMRGNAVVSNETASGYDFSGPFQLTADGVAAPGAQATVEGNAGNFYPFGFTTALASSMRYQQVYAASEFGCPGVARDITALAFRLDESGAPFSSTLPAVQINLSTTAAAPDALDANFFSNVGSDDTVVYAGSLALSSAGTGGPPADFDIVILLDPPFRYDPSQGNLLLDVRNYSAGSQLAYLDIEETNADPVSRVVATSASAVTGTPSTAGLVTRFTFHVPSPLKLDFGEVDGHLLPGGDVRIEGVGVSAMAKRFLFDITPDMTSLQSMRLTGTLGTGTLGPASGSAPLTKKTLPLPGLLRLCFFVLDCDVINLRVPFTKDGTQGVGVGGTQVLLNASYGPTVVVSIQAAPWTIGAASVAGIPTAAGGAITSTYPSFRHGPASLATTATQSSGVIQLVAPAMIASNQINIEPIPMFSVMRVRFVPEPGLLLLIGPGVLGLLVLGRRRIQR